MRKSCQHLTACKCASSLTCQLVTVSSPTRVNCENETAGAFANDFAYLALATFVPAFARSTRRQVTSAWRGSRQLVGAVITSRHVDASRRYDSGRRCLDRWAGGLDRQASRMPTRWHELCKIVNR